MGSLLFAYLAAQTIPLVFVAFLLLAITVSVLALVPDTRSRFAPALFWGCVGHALSPFVVAIIYQVLPPSGMAFNLLTSPMSFLHGVLWQVGEWSFLYRDFLLATLNVGAAVGFFAGVYFVIAWLRPRK